MFRLQSQNQKWEKYFVIRIYVGTPQFAFVIVFRKMKKGTEQLLCKATFDLDMLIGSRGKWLCHKPSHGCKVMAQVKSAPDANISITLNEAKQSLF